MFLSLRTDCIVSGVSLYTPNLLLVLAYNELEEDLTKNDTSNRPARKGRHHRQSALEPELRLIDLATKEEVSADTLNISRYEGLSASDYHLGVLPPITVATELTQQGAFGAIGSGIGTIGSGIYTGVEAVGQGVWDATMYPTRTIGANRLFSSGGSIRSAKTGNEKSSSAKVSGYLTSWIPGFGSASKEIPEAATALGMKIFICSPYDCIVAVKRNLTDRLQWLIKMERYQQAWELLDNHPEAVGVAPSSDESAPATPSKASSTATGPSQMLASSGLAEFFADTTSISSQKIARDFNSAAEKEKRRIGELWLQQLMAANDWHSAGEVAGKVLGTTSRWDHWIWVFIRNNKFDHITPYIPTFQLTPPLPSLIYEIILGHYVTWDRCRFKELLDLWPSDLFDIGSITTAIEDQTKNDSAPIGSEDWRILQECLAKLFIAGGRFGDALRSYINLQDADAALALIEEHHLLSAVADDLLGLILLRISSEQLQTSSNNELKELSSEPIKLLVDESITGVIQPENVVDQLEDSSHSIFLFFYLRALWRGAGRAAPATTSRHRFGHASAKTNLAVDEGKSLVERVTDLAVQLFADYDREILKEFLHTSTAYKFDKAVQVCEHHHFVPELVYLLSKTGQTKKALFLIIDELKDVVQAITFAKEQDDDDLWEDLLEYSMSRPKFISGLLAEVGTAIDPIKLVKRIPSGLEIEGLKDGLKKMIREYDLQDSISTGVAKVLQGEVAVGMEILRKGRSRGIKFDVTVGGKRTRSEGKNTGPRDKPEGDHQDEQAQESAMVEFEPGHCAGCGEAFAEDETEVLVGLACGHVYHLPHLLHGPSSSWSAYSNPRPANELNDDDDSPFPSTFTKTVGPKVTNARLLRDKIAAIGGCRICAKKNESRIIKLDGAGTTFQGIKSSSGACSESK